MRVLKTAYQPAQNAPNTGSKGCSRSDRCGKHSEEMLLGGGPPEGTCDPPHAKSSAVDKINCIALVLALLVHFTPDNDSCETELFRLVFEPKVYL